MFLGAHPRFVEESGGLCNGELSELAAKLRSENSGLLKRTVELGSEVPSHTNTRLINCLSGNTQVRKVTLHLDCCLESEETFRSLVDWLNWRGDKCELHLTLTHLSVRALMERRASVLSSSATNLKLKRVYIFRGADEILSDEWMTKIFSLVTAETNIEVRCTSLGTIRRSVLPHIRGITNLDLGIHFGTYGGPIDIHELFQSILSHRNIRGQLRMTTNEDSDLFQFVDCLNQYQGQYEATLSKLDLSLTYTGRIGGYLATGLEQIPSRLPVGIGLQLCSDFGAHETADEALLQSLLSLPSLTSLLLLDIDYGDLSQWVNMIEELFHGRLHTFELQAKMSSAAHCLARSLHSSDLQVLHLYAHTESANELVEVAHAMADVLPTMTLLKEFLVVDEGEQCAREFEQRVSNKQDYEKYLTTSTSRHLPTYVAYDALYTAVCDHPPSITTCRLPKFTEWHRDRLALALQTRLICVEKLLLSSNETPVSLLPLALSRLSEGHWYDIMAYIVRQKSDVLIAPSMAAGLNEDIY